MSEEDNFSYELSSDDGHSVPLLSDPPKIIELGTSSSICGKFRIICQQCKFFVARKMKCKSIKSNLIKLLLGSMFFFLFFTHKNNVKSYYYTSTALKTVRNKKDLLKIDITNQLRYKDLSRTPITPDILHYNFTAVNVTGFVSNLQLEKTANSEVNSNGIIPEASYHQEYDSLVSCNDLQYNNIMELSRWNILLPDDLVALRRELTNDKTKLSKELEDDNEKMMSETEIIGKNWLRFGGAAVWLESELCFVVYTRVIYSPEGFKGAAKLSLVRAQAFDKDWNEIKGKRIPFSDVPIPKEVTKELSNLEKNLDYSTCDNLKISDREYYNDCIVQITKKKLKFQQRYDELLSRYYLTYPSVINIPLDLNGYFNGPEDPHVILRKNDKYEEPIIIFNMQDNDEDKRRIYAFHPHRKIDALVKFSIEGRKLRDKEKNWAPFFPYHDENKDSVFSRGFIYFIYTYAPLEIVKCSLNDGICEMVFEAATIEASGENAYDDMRGGTQFVKLPADIPQVEGKQMWLGFPKSHSSGCGCGSTYYRPMLSLLIETHGAYHLELMVPTMDFERDVLSWDLKGTYCEGVSIMSPNSIAYWEVVDQDVENEKFEDYLGFTFSESDATSKVVVLRNVLNYILEIYKEKRIRDQFEISKESDSIIRNTLKCVKDKQWDDCTKYGVTQQKKLIVVKISLFMFRYCNH
ncbi:hypothetical protein KAFR_0A03580 [Kazachstania africana CBS 2517]|uniref:Uncharacterized protein n=1 Tax=Kazachstania africana (strain ATCC 22294 / BCRC 22015 / CBS 2517 / CECT 1963 / NBRC 1671 / NRRL Y-8276) TaxID=1071382 RepID=H2AN43_KAZAF|nr:hypothetical protein KAFR_0A03580 [Kazachstania africana CBS 2517]CCF55793.1 hypothetical protein KAFR_0A03580 [Kazachstania africana CBS 2517]